MHMTFPYTHEIFHVPCPYGYTEGPYAYGEYTHMARSKYKLILNCSLNLLACNSLTAFSVWKGFGFWLCAVWHDFEHRNNNGTERLTILHNQWPHMYIQMWETPCVYQPYGQQISILKMDKWVDTILGINVLLLIWRHSPVGAIVDIHRDNWLSLILLCGHLQCHTYQ